MRKKFLRRTWSRYSKLGKRRKKKQVWRKPTGRDNKMREKRKGYPSVVSIGYKKEKKKSVIVIKNIKDFENTKKEDILLIGKVGRKKKIEIAKKGEELKIEFRNLNIKKFLKKLEKKKVKEKARENKLKTKKK